jgi:hypothetical protein
VPGPHAGLKPHVVVEIEHRLPRNHPRPALHHPLALCVIIGAPADYPQPELPSTTKELDSCLLDSKLRDP